MEEEAFDSVNEDEYSEWYPRHSEEPAQVQQVFVTREPARRGRLKIHEQWTRIIHVKYDDEIRSKTWLISTDLLMAQGIS